MYNEALANNKNILLTLYPNLSFIWKIPCICFLKFCAIFEGMMISFISEVL